MLLRAPKVGSHPVNGSQVAHISNNIDHVSMSAGQFEGMFFDELVDGLGEEPGESGPKKRSAMLGRMIIKTNYRWQQLLRRSLTA